MFLAPVSFRQRQTPAAARCSWWTCAQAPSQLPRDDAMTGPNRTDFRQRFEILSTVLLTAAALVLRLSALDLTPYNIDESLLSIFASQAGTLREFPLRGIRTSFGFHNPPLLVWLMAPFFAISKDPRLAMAAMAVAGAAAVPLTGLAVSRISDVRVGTVAAAIVAFSPAAIDHSRRLWGHDTIVFFSALTLFLAVFAIRRSDWRWMAASMASAAAAQCCHLSGALIWIVPLGALLAFKPPWWRKSLLGGFAALAFFYAPWLVRDSGLTGGEPFAETGLILRVLSGQAGGAGTPGHSTALVSWLCATTDLAASDAAGDSWPLFFQERPALRAVRWIVCASFAALVVGGIARALRTRTPERPWLLVLAVAAVAPLAVFALLPVATVPAYQLPALLPAAVLAGYAIDGLRVRRFQPGLVALLLFVVWAHWQVFALRAFLASADGEDRIGGLLRHKQAVVRHIAEAGGAPGTYAVAQDGRLSETGVDYWVMFLHFVETGDPDSPTGPAERLFVVRHNRTRLRPEVVSALEPLEFAGIGPWRVYEFSGPEAAAWRETVRRFPASPAP